MGVSLLIVPGLESNFMISDGHTDPRMLLKYKRQLLLSIRNDRGSQLLYKSLGVSVTAVLAAAKAVIDIIASSWKANVEAFKTVSK